MPASPSRQGIALGDVGFPKWAADGNIGHGAWLKAGGEQLILDAMNLHGGQLRPGDRLDDLLTEPHAVQFLRVNPKQTLEGLTQGRPASLVVDEIRAELASQAHSIEGALLDTANNLLCCGRKSPTPTACRDTQLVGPELSQCELSTVS